jgi:non-heme chloroperoxidase
VTETVLIPGRGHGLVIDSGWREVCDISLAFISRFVNYFDLKNPSGRG